MLHSPKCGADISENLQRRDLRQTNLHCLQPLNTTVDNVKENQQTNSERTAFELEHNRKIENVMYSKPSYLLQSTYEDIR